jgi:putative endonuclease
LLYWESFDEVLNAIDREKQLKGWRRRKKIALIESVNPQWLDLSREWYPGMKDGGADRDASTL